MADSLNAPADGEVEENKYAVNFEDLDAIIKASIARPLLRKCASPECKHTLSVYTDGEYCNGCSGRMKGRKHEAAKLYRICATSGCTRAIGGSTSCTYCEECLKARRHLTGKAPEPVSLEAIRLEPIRLEPISLEPVTLEPIEQLVPPKVESRECPYPGCKARIIGHNNKSGWCRKHNYKSRLTKETAQMETQHATTPTHTIRKCAKDDCQAEITPANKSGYCAKHWYDSQKAKRTVKSPVQPAMPDSETPHADAYLERQKARRQPAQERLEAVVLRAVARDENSAMTLLITSKQADKLFGAMSDNDKCSILQGFIDQLGDE